MIRGSDTPTQHGMTNEMADEEMEGQVDLDRGTRLIHNESQDVIGSPQPGTLVIMHNSEDGMSQSQGGDKVSAREKQIVTEEDIKQTQM